MDQRLSSYLRSFRRRGGLTQAELAFLIRIKSASLISRFEELQRMPSLRTAFACELIFNASPVELFPGVFDEVREAVYGRATELYEQLQGDPSAATRAKLDFLESVLSRTDQRVALDV